MREIENKLLEEYAKETGETVIVNHHCNGATLKFIYWLYGRIRTLEYKIEEMEPETLMYDILNRGPV